MKHLLVSLLLPALAIALNPVPIIAVATLLAARRGRRDAAAFAASLVVVMAADGLLTIHLLGDASRSQNADTAAHGAVQMALGLVFLALFVVQWRSRPTAPGETPGWMKMLDKAGLGAAVVLGLALTNYALLSEGVATIVAARRPRANEVAALAFFIALSVSTVVVPLVLCLVLPHWTKVRLARLEDWLTRHSRFILLAVFGAMGALATTQGVITLLI